jgi:hypothetical protein
MEYNDKNLGPIKRSKRNDWGKTVEDLLYKYAPKPISYDVDGQQGPGFTEYTYTEFLGGVYIKTQSVEIDCRIFEDAAKVSASRDHLPDLDKKLVDKYELSSLPSEGVDFPKDVAFFVGQNMLDLVSREIIGRQVFENPDFKVKLHPLTDPPIIEKIAGFIGWDKIISPKVSGMQCLLNCETAYVTTATELAATAVCKDKEIINCSNFFHESIGVYYPLNKLLFAEPSKSVRKTIINNIVDYKGSGLIFPWMDDVEERIKAYFENSLHYREHFSPRASHCEMKKIPVSEVEKQKNSEKNKQDK